MRGIVLTTAAVAAAIGLAVAGEPEYGTVTDSRDGQTYRTVKIGRQTWMAQNLNYKMPDSSWCYKNSVDSCNKYGRLYAWNAAKKACPTGYHLPSRKEWGNLVVTVGGENVAGKKLKSKYGWTNWEGSHSGNGTDDYGFSALPDGFRNYSYGTFYDVGHGGYWWTATEIDTDYAYDRAMGYNTDFAYDGYDSKSRGFSVRCVADSP